MEKILFFYVFLYSILQITSSDVSEEDVTLLRFQLNGNISLSCSMTNKQVMAWYHQNPDSGRLTRLVYFMSFGSNDNINIQSYRLMRSNRTSLVITGLTESDSGLYFCGTSSGYSAMLFDKPFRLQLEDGVHSVTEPPQDVEITDGLTVTERVLIFSGVGLAVFVFFLATIIAGGIIHSHGWQKGWTAAKRAGLTDQNSPK